MWLFISFSVVVCYLSVSLFIICCCRYSSILSILVYHFSVLKWSISLFINTLVNYCCLSMQWSMSLCVNYYLDSLTILYTHGQCSIYRLTIQTILPYLHITSLSLLSVRCLSNCLYHQLSIV